MNISFLNAIDPKKLIDPKYLFEIKPEPESSYLYLLVIFGLLIILSIIFWIKERKKEKSEPIKKINQRFVTLFFYTGIVGFILIFFRWQSLPYLGSRIMMIFFFAVFIVFLFLILWQRFVILPKVLAEIRKKEDFEKYLPRSSRGLPRRQAGLPHKAGRASKKERNE